MGSVGISHDKRLLPGVFAELLRGGQLEASGLTLHQYAPVPQFRAHLDPVGCGSIVRSHGRVPRREAYSIMRGSDILLLLPMTIDAFQHVGLKEMECVASGSPVLVLGKPLEEFEPVMRAAPHVRIVHTAQEGAAFIEGELRRFAAGETSAFRSEVNGPWVRDFTWPAQAARLSDLLEGCRRKQSANSSDSREA